MRGPAQHRWWVGCASCPRSCVGCDTEALTSWGPLAGTETVAYTHFPDVQRTAFCSVLLVDPVGVWQPSPPRPRQPPPPHLSPCCGAGIARPQPGGTSWPCLPSPHRRMFSRNPQSFDDTHIARHNVTFPAGDGPTWGQLLHMVFIFVLEKAPDTFGQSASCQPRCWGRSLPTPRGRGCGPAPWRVRPGAGNGGARPAWRSRDPAACWRVCTLSLCCAVWIRIPRNQKSRALPKGLILLLHKLHY